VLSTRRTFLLILAVLAIPFGLFLLWAQFELGPQLEERAVGQLSRTARLIGEDFRDRPFSDSLADRLGEITDLRVTLISRDGSVIGDSEIDPARLPTVENHADRPEVEAALSGVIGHDTRASETIALRLLYVAVPDPHGAVRVAIPLVEVREFLIRARQVAAGTALLALILALVLAGLLHRFRMAPVERLASVIRDLGSGDLGRRTGGGGHGVLSVLGQAIDEMAGRLEERFTSLEAERSDLETVFDRLDTGLAVVDPDGHIRRVNQAFETWVGRREIEGSRLASLFRDPRNREAIESALAGSESRHESELGPRTILLSALPLEVGALVVIQDLTRTRQLEGVRRDFVANVSHELKTPLTNMRGFAEPLADGDLPDEQSTEFAGRILANVERMQSLIDDLLDLSRIESGVWTPEPDDISLGGLVDSAWNSLLPRQEDRNIELERDFPSDLQIRVDRDALVQVLCNLLDNAVRYTPEGGSVRLTTSRNKDRTRIEVSDHGPGIPTAQLKRVFERFYRVDTARSRQAGGTGLGLSIVKHLVAAHGGEVGIESELGTGTTVWFTIPDSASGDPFQNAE
jgi:two-component system phosphate regulon sensor histidine kinase PhoR